MSSTKYGKDFAVPKDFPSVLKAFTREVLRNQPENIYEFGAQYFTEVLAQLQDEQAQQGSSMQRLTPAELAEMLSTLFHQADKDGSGALSIAEFKAVFQPSLFNLHLSSNEVRRVISEFDVNGDGEIDYAEFVPLAVDLVQGFYARADTEQTKAAEEAREEKHREAVRAALVQGNSKQQLQAIMLDIFQKADTDGSGALSLPEFHACIREADLGLTRHQINVLMHEVVDYDKDGSISYEEFAPLCFEILVEMLKDELMASEHTPSKLEEWLSQVFHQADPNNSGKLEANAMGQLLRSADFGMTRLQIHAVLAEADQDDQGFVDIDKFVPVAAEMLFRLKDPNSELAKAQAIQALSERGLG